MIKWLILCGALVFLAPSAFAQATSRPCDPAAAADTPAPACLLAHLDIGPLPQGDLYWHITGFSDPSSAEAARGAGAVVRQAFGKYWVFAIGPKTEGDPQAVQIGPLPLNRRDGDFAAEFLESTFSPGMTAPVHVHSGPEAFFAVTGGTCLESPDGVQTAGSGAGLMIRQGPPMLLMATGPDLRRGFALILHDRSQPPTTLTHDWQPRGLCHS